MFVGSVLDDIYDTKYKSRPMVSYVSSIPRISTLVDFLGTMLGMHKERCGQTATTDSDSLQRNQVAVIHRTMTTSHGTSEQQVGEEPELVTDHTVEWRLAAAILDRFFMVVNFLMLLGLIIWMVVRIQNR